MPEAVTGIVIVKRLLDVASDFKTRVGDRIYTSHSEGFDNASPGVILVPLPSNAQGDAPVEALEVLVHCFGGQNAHGVYLASEAAETQRLLWARLWEVQNESVTGGRVLTCTRSATPVEAEDEDMEWPVSVSQWEFLVVGN